MSSTKSTFLLFTVLGGLIGTLVAAGGSRDRPLVASENEAAPSASAQAPSCDRDGSADLPSCCDQGLTAGRTQLAGALASATAILSTPANAAQDEPAGSKTAQKPNIVIIWGDDIGQSNVSAYTMGLMGYRTPNIDRIAREGMIFTDYYGEQSCTAGRASFITGQHGMRTGLTKVGLPGATVGLQKEDPTIADLLKAHGLRDRADRQEPPRRPQRVSPDRPRLRRVLRQPLPPQRGRGAGTAGLSEGPRVPQAVRPARGAGLQGHRRG